MTAARTRGTAYRCDRCDRPLRHHTDGRARWIYSPHTGARYCYPGDGCNKQPKPRPTRTMTVAQDLATRRGPRPEADPAGWPHRSVCGPSSRPEQP